MELDTEIMRIVSEFAQEITDDIEQEFAEIGNEAVQELEQTSPRDTGDYASKWRSKIIREYGTVKVVVSNQKYQLTHLLENGTTNADGTQRTQPQEHIGPANENAQRKALEFMGGDQ